MGETLQVNHIIAHMEKIIVGKRKVLQTLFVALLSEGHVLIQDVPGVGKTQLVATLSKSVNGKFHRVQFTPDVMPSDIMGFSMFNPASREFEFREGAAMCNFFLADEINRASPKTQSSLLEMMEEYQVTVDGKTYPLPRPFIVLATQNPIESFGTYPLPEAQMDRFFIRLSVGYPSKEEENLILERFGSQNPLVSLQALTDTEYLLTLQKEVKEVKVADALRAYIVDLIDATRKHPDVILGVSPRGSLHLYKAAKAWAYLQDRAYVTPDDIQEMSLPVLSHRILLHAGAKLKNSSGEDIVKDAILRVKVPAF